MSGSDVRLSVVIPTIGRASITEALCSCATVDEIVVVADEARGPVELPVLPKNAVRMFVNGGDHGYTARTAGMAAATGTHICFLDDDDVYTPDAVRLFKEHACDVPVIFRMDHYRHGTLWRGRVVEFGNVSTQMFVVPNIPDKLGTWAPHAPGLPEPGGDYTFLKGCVEKMGVPVWRDETVAILRPHFPTLTIVTAWKDHPELVEGYLRAVSFRGPRDQVVIVDNGSETPLDFPGCHILQLGENTGFCAGNNHGLAVADTDAVIFLNNDVVATRADWVDEIRAALDPGVLVGAKLRTDPHADVDGQNMPYLDGWCLAGMKADLDELGGWPEDLEEPAYYSDNILSLRARAAGMTLREVQTGLVHLNGVTSGAGRGTDVSQVTLANQARYVAEARGLLVAA